MSSIQALRERLAAVNQKANALLADKGSQTWSPEDQAAFDADMDESERLQRQIAAHEKMIAADREDNFADADQFRRDPKDKGKKTPAAQAFDTFLRKSFSQMTVDEMQAVRNTMSTTTGSQGGFTVQTEVATQLIDYLKSYAFMRAVASQITTEKGNDLSYPTSDGTSELGEWVPQNTTANAADPVFGTIALNVFKAGSKVVAVPIELLQDSQIDIQAMVFKRLADRIGRISNQGYTTGTGSGQPMGLVTAAGVGKVGATGSTTTVGYDDLVDLVDSLDVAYLPVPTTSPQLNGAEPGWMFSQATRRVVRKLKDTSGRPLWMPSYDEGLTTATPDRLLGFPVYLNNDMPSMAANAKSIAFGNFQKYMIRDAMDVTIFRFDDSAYMKLGQVGYLAWARTGGNLLDVNSVKLYQNSAT